MSSQRGRQAALLCLGIGLVAVTFAALARAEAPGGEAGHASGMSGESTADDSHGSRPDVGVHSGDVGDTGDTDADASTADPVSPEKRAAGRQAFSKVANVLKSPRCMNCHPDGDRPLQTDESVPHKMNISRRSLNNGMECSTCHRDRNSEAYGVEGGPPGAPHWGLPPADTPMIFEGRTPAELCRQLQDPARNGGKSMSELMHHVAEDPLVLWGWNPGGDRTKPPLSHEAFVEAFRTWVESEGACPREEPDGKRR